MTSLPSLTAGTALAAADLVLLDHSYAALYVPLPAALPEPPPVAGLLIPTSVTVQEIPSVSEPLFPTSSTEQETPLVRGLRHADEFYKKLVRDSSQKQVYKICFLFLSALTFTLLKS